MGEPGAGAVEGAGVLLSVGAFAARARLSRRALRLYDRTGLLAPAHVDEESGYRYYRAEQVEHARLVALLRRLDMPLALIAEVMREPGDTAAHHLALYWRGVEERIAAQRILVEYLRGRLSGRSSELDEKFRIRTRDVPAQYVISQSRHTLANGLPAWIGSSMTRLTAAAEECGGVAGPPFVVYHAEVTDESDGPVETCVPVRDRVAARAWALDQGRSWGSRAREEGAHRLAYTRITKAQVVYPEIIAAFEAVEEWIAGQRLRVAGPSREVYFTDWSSAGPDDEVCDVAFPVTA
ncbi:MerR family transcriptional regulator [Streptomyces sp. TS71-3]|uniref:MerR family transcriptional regulator n=1 Tax=Streptomyces sp. TS71-3 TaxID=2733862 RepID=UPI002016D73B|nr:MerR family transcriptional regulator [Streptomyces sp. TS71-3]